MIRRICLFAGPGAGKSTLAAWAFAKMKMDGVNVEHVSEYVKAWAYIGRTPTSYDQLYILAKQMHKEDIVLRNDPKSRIISDCPLFLGICYARKFQAKGWENLIGIIRDFEASYPSVNLFIDRKSMEYKKEGRFQDAAGAVEMDNAILETLNHFHVPYTKVAYDDLEAISEIINASIEVK